MVKYMYHHRERNANSFVAASLSAERVALLSLEKLRELPFAEQDRIFHSGFAMWQQVVAPVAAGSGKVSEEDTQQANIVYGPDQRTAITATTQRVLFAVYAPPGDELG